MFESRIAHGMLTASLVSTVLGTRLPGPGAVYVSQSIRFLAPVRIGDTVIARAQVAEVVTDKRRVRMTTLCTVGDKKVLDGEAVLMVPSRPNGAGWKLEERRDRSRRFAWSDRARPGCWTRRLRNRSEAMATRAGSSQGRLLRLDPPSGVGAASPRRSALNGRSTSAPG